MCMSGRCSSCQHAAIDAGINHHDLYAVIQHAGRGLRKGEDKPDPVIVDLSDDEILDRMGRSMQHKITHTSELSKPEK